MSPLVRDLFEGPVDIVGDVHGELDALRALLKHLGYRSTGEHPQARRLVFIGDLVDRGPDSPGVLRLVHRLVATGRAQAVLGNHEINALCNDASVGRSGEGWWYGRKDPEHPDSAVVSDTEKRERFLPFLGSLPLALVRTGLRVVHACWHDEAVRRVRQSDADARSLFDAMERRNRASLKELKEASDHARQSFDLRRRSPPVPYLKAVADYSVGKVMGNPVRVLTGGIEEARGTARFLSGKWRFTERMPWWMHYHGPPVVVGHFWRLRTAPSSSIFGGAGPTEWLGPSRRVMCVDYSVGRRFRDRAMGSDAFTTHLGALRTPEWELHFDDGRVMPVGAPGGSMEVKPPRIP